MCGGNQNRGSVMAVLGNRMKSIILRDAFYMFCADNAMPYSHLPTQATSKEFILTMRNSSIVRVGPMCLFLPRHDGSWFITIISFISDCSLHRSLLLGLLEIKVYVYYHLLKNGDGLKCACVCEGDEYEFAYDQHWNVCRPIQLGIVNLFSSAQPS